MLLHNAMVPAVDRHQIKRGVFSPAATTSSEADMNLERF